MFLLCKTCKQEWKIKTLELHRAGVGPLAISVRLNKPWKEIVCLLNRFGKINEDEWNMTSGGSFVDILDSPQD